MKREDLIGHLSRPEAYTSVPGAVSEVGFLETHISLLFFAGLRVYKVKKAVDRGFLDYTTLALRKHFCEEEVRLNRRLAPKTYLGIVPIVRAPEGHLVVDGEGEPVEWAVEMVRLPNKRMLSTLLERGVIDNSEMNSVVDLLVDFHRGAPTGPGVDEHGTLESISTNVEENFEQIEGFDEGEGPAALVSRAQFELLAHRQRHFLRVERELLERRVREGRIREGHGDLHAGNLCLTEAGVVAYDCIEFNRRFRCGDVAAEVAFLAMDLDQRGYPAFSSYFAWQYAHRADDPELSELIGFYKTYRAIVRAKVTAMALADLEPGDAREPELAAEAMRYFQLAASYELPPALLVVCGLPGVGKTWMARRLARALRAVVLSGDLRRERELAAANGEAGPLATELSMEGYRALSRDAIANLDAGHSVIVDAPFSRRELRTGFVDAAERLGLPYQVVHVTAPEELVRRRIEADSTSVELEDYLRAREAFELPEEVPEGHGIEVTSEAGSPEERSGLVLDRMIAFDGSD